MAKTLSQRIRKVALGPTPVASGWLYGWADGVGTDMHIAMMEHAKQRSKGVTEFTDANATEIQRRMFLLFVAEAVDD